MWIDSYVSDRSSSFIEMSLFTMMSLWIRHSSPGDKTRASISWTCMSYSNMSYLNNSYVDPEARFYPGACMSLFKYVIVNNSYLNKSIHVQKIEPETLSRWIIHNDIIWIRHTCPGDRSSSFYLDMYESIHIWHIWIETYMSRR